MSWSDKFIAIGLGVSPFVIVIIGLVLVAHRRPRAGFIVVACGFGLYVLMVIGIEVARYIGAR